MLLRLHAWIYTYLNIRSSCREKVSFFSRLARARCRFSMQMGAFWHVYLIPTRGSRRFLVNIPTVWVTGLNIRPKNGRLALGGPQKWLTDGRGMCAQMQGRHKDSNLTPQGILKAEMSRWYSAIFFCNFQPWLFKSAPNNDRLAAHRLTVRELSDLEFCLRRKTGR